jgi:signal transduction histidine kinase
MTGMTGMTAPPASPRRSLQARLTLFYATGIFAAGIVVLAVVAVPLAGIRSAAPKGSRASGAITGTGNGIGPHQLLVGSAVALALLIPIALAAGWFVAGRFLRPLRAITATARAISAGNLHQRLGLGEPADELTELGAILDDLFARLEASFDAQRHFVANASHELRTPLAGLRTLLEVTLADPGADAGTLRSACQEALALGGHQERLVQALLTLATSERGITRRDTLDLAQAAAGVLASRRDQAAETGVDLAEHLMPAVTAGDPGLIESLIANLIDNAIRHNHPGGHVQVTTQTSGPQATLTVINSGPVIPGDQIQRLFQPFQRLAPDRNGPRDGYGIGLAIVNAVTQAHHATLTTSARPEGGLSITVRFAPVPGSCSRGAGRAATDSAATTAATSSPPRRW